MEKRKHGIGKDDASHRDRERAGDTAGVTSQQETAAAGGVPEGYMAEGAASEAAGVKDRISELEELLKQKEAEAATNWDKFLRERADLENFRKRAQREKEELLKYGNESILLEILPVIDNMERALAHASEESLSAVIEGVNITLSMLISVLKKFGVEPLDSKGKPFDPAFHQAMTQLESNEHAPNTIIDEFQKGYMLNDRLLRAALVSVATAAKNGDA